MCRGGGRRGLFVSAAHVHCPPFYKLSTRIYLGTSTGYLSLLYKKWEPRQLLTNQKSIRRLRNIPPTVQGQVPLWNIHWTRPLRERSPCRGAIARGAGLQAEVVKLDFATSTYSGHQLNLASNYWTQNIWRVQVEGFFFSLAVHSFFFKVTFQIPNCLRKNLSEYFAI